MISVGGLPHASIGGGECLSQSLIKVTSGFFRAMDPMVLSGHLYSVTVFFGMALSFLPSKLSIQQRKSTALGE